MKYYLCFFIQVDPINIIIETNQEVFSLYKKWHYGQNNINLSQHPAKYT